MSFPAYGERSGFMRRFPGALLFVLLTWMIQPSVQAQERGSESSEPEDPIGRIRAEGLDHSKVMETLSTLTEVIGSRLTGSPNLKRANEWTRDQLQSWGLTNAHL